MDATLAAAIAIGLAGIGTGIAQGLIGAAAIGAVAEKEETFGKALVFVVIPETIIIFGFVVAALILFGH